MRYCLVLFALGALACLAEGPAPASVKGTLNQQPGKPALETAGHKIVFLDGDAPVRGVLEDKRLAGADLQAMGRFTAPDHFQIDPIHTRPLRVFKDGKPKLVTYWCETCSIRTWTPGKCWCCQEETALDLRDPETLPQ
jgi:hypothetical protein